MKRLHLIILCLCAICAKAQNLTHDFQGQSLSQALIWIDNAQSSYKLNFIFDELEDFTVTTSLKNVSVRDAVRQVCGFYPMHLTFDEQDIYIECTQKAETKLSGQIIDESGQPLPYVSITLLSLNDSTFLTGGISNEAGDFVIPCSLQRVLARFTCIGYKTIEKTCNVGNIGKIRMTPDQYTINGVEVKGHKRLVYTNDKGLVANVKGTALEQFSSVSEMLTHLPLMMSDGSIAGHGKPEIYINNKKVRNDAELKRYRADEILTAEIITNPGAEYGAEVTSVIKLKTVKRAGEGWSGSFSTGYRQGKENYASANASLNYRTHHGMDFFGGVYFNHLNQLINATANDQLQSSSTWNYQREAEWLYHFNYFFGDLGWNWDINEHHSVGVHYTPFSYLGNKPDCRSNDEKTWRNGELVDGGHSETYTTRKPKVSHSINAYYVGEIGKWGIDFSADYYRAPSVSEMEGGTIGEPIVSSSSTAMNKLVAEKLVIKAPVTKGNLSLGEEVSGVDRTTDFVQSGYAQDNHVKQQTNTWSLFADYSVSLGKFNINAGMRWQNEQNRYDVDGQRNEEMSPDYSILIPRASIGYQTETWRHKLSFITSRHNPQYQLLSSDVHYRSKYEYDMGNPLLKPQTARQLSWSSQRNWFYAEVFYQHIKNAIRSFQYAYDDVNRPGVMMMDYRNTPTQQIYGLTLNFSPKIGIWQMNYTANVYFSDEDLEALGITHKWNGVCTDFVLDNTFSLPKSWTLNIQGSITPYRESGCAQTKATGFLDFRLSKQFLKDKSLSVAILAKDILHTQYNEMTAYGGINVRTHFRQYDDNRRVGIDVSWNFNATRSRYKGSHAGQSERDRL